MFTGALRNVVVRGGPFAELPNVTAQEDGVEPSDTPVLEGLRLLREARIEPPNVRPAGG